VIQERGEFAANDRDGGDCYTRHIEMPRRKLLDANDYSYTLTTGFPLSLLLRRNSSPCGKWLAASIRLATALTGSRGAVPGLATVLPNTLVAFGMIPLLSSGSRQ